MRKVMNEKPGGFETAIRARARQVTRGRLPSWRYDPEGDCAEFLFLGDDFYAERVDSFVTVYYSRRTKQLIGSLIKGLRRHISKEAPGLRIEIQDGKIKLTHILRSKLWSSDLEPKSEKAIIYQKLIQKAEETEAEAALGPFAGVA